MWEIEENKTAHHFVRIGSECPFIGPELEYVVCPQRNRTFFKKRFIDKLIT
jgi:hypothetical protein